MAALEPTPADSEAPLRSRAWFGDGGKNGFISRHHLRAMGRGGHNFDGRPVIGICNTFSELTPCNGHLQLIADAVKRGVLQAAWLPPRIPRHVPG